MSDITNDDVVKALGNLTVMQLLTLTKELEQKWGVEAKPPAQAVHTQPEPQAPVKDEFNVVLASYPADKKMSVLKAVREVLGLGLKEAKDFIEAVPKMVKESVSKSDADDLVAKFTAAGGVMSVT